MWAQGHEFAAAVEGYVGTPWKHQGRLPGVGLDCAGLVACGLRSVGEDPADEIDYPRQPDKRRILKWLTDHCDRIPGDPEIGDILLFGTSISGTHIGVMTRAGLTHAWLRDSIREGKVVTVDFSPGGYWRKCLLGAWRYRGRKDS
jgi:cell wall-associated NlpC family hydrolase